MNMINKFRYLALILLFSIFSIYAQDGSYSPFSYYKFGDQVEKQTVENLSMGHLNVYNDTLHYNFMLPSSLANLKLVNYSVASAFDVYLLKSGNIQGRAGVFMVPYVTLGVPVGKRGGIGFGFKPYSTSGYLIMKELENEKIAKTGEGGLNRVFVAAGLKLYKGLNAGISYNYYFGNKIARFIHYKQDVYAISRQVDNAVYSGSNLDFSMDLTHFFNRKYYFQAALLYTLPVKIISENTSTLEISDSSYGRERIVRTMNLRQDTTLQFIPAGYSIGFGFGMKRKWYAGVEWQTEKWSGYQNDFFTSDKVSYKNASVLKMGGFWLPDFRSHVKYYKRITYKAGFYYKNGDLVFDNQPVNEFGMSFGLSLPMNYYFSAVNIGLEYVKRGGPDLISEKIIKLKIGLSFKDKWFVKRKIN